jgi:hypothetical protein
MMFSAGSGCPQLTPDPYGGGGRAGSFVIVRRFLTPKWVLLHVLCLIAFLVCLRLGLWQWDRAKSHSGTMQNFGYALQWPLFAGFVVVLWWRTIRDVLHPKQAGDDSSAQSDATGAPLESAATAAPTVPTAPTAPTKPARPVVATPVLPTDEEDPEVAAYNRYLASLYARDEERERQRRARRTAGARGGSA